MLANRAANMRSANRIRAHSNMAQAALYGQGGDNMNRIAIPAIEITKETPSTGRPAGSYSEEEFDASMKHRLQGYNKRPGISPLPPQRTRVISDFEKSNFGPLNQMHNRRMPKEHGVRWFVALFDYDPLSMSPNPDAAEEELPFQEGQLIKVCSEQGFRLRFIFTRSFYPDLR